jgi:hypothetical protein
MKLGGKGRKLSLKSDFNPSNSSAFKGSPLKRATKNVHKAV